MTGGGRRRTRSAGDALRGAASPPRRRSERLSSPPTRTPSLEKPHSDGRRECTAVLGSRPITLKKIRPRHPQQVKRTPLSRRQSPRVSPKEEKENVVPRSAPQAKSPDVGTKREPFRRSSSESVLGEPQGGFPVLSPISINVPEAPTCDPRDLTMAKRVRRSYSRLEVSFAGSFLEGSSDTPSPNRGPVKRQTLFGFEKLLLPEEVSRASPPKATETGRDRDPLQEPDTDIPGIAFCKEKRRKKKVPQFDKSKLDQWAAEMNAEFEEAERFNLLVE